MKAKIILMLIISTLIVSSNVVNATFLNKKDAETKQIYQMVGERKITLDTNSWDDHESDAKKLDGDPKVIAYNNSQGGHAYTKCNHGTGTEKGEAWFTLMEYWTSPYDIQANTYIGCYFDWKVNMFAEGVIIAGFWTHVKLIFTFFICEADSGKEIAFGTYSKWNNIYHLPMGDYEETNACYSNTYTKPEEQESFKNIAFEKGKTYVFGLKAYTWVSTSIAMGSITSIVSVTHNTNTNTNGNFYISWIDNAPKKPITPNGPKKVNLFKKFDGVECTYSTSTTDIDDEFINYSWEVNNIRTTVGPIRSGETCKYTHKWEHGDVFNGDKKIYNIKVIACGATADSPIYSEYSEVLQVEVIKEKSRTYDLSRLLSNFPLLAHLFEKLMSLR